MRSICPGREIGPVKRALLTAAVLCLGGVVAAFVWFSRTEKEAPRNSGITVPSGMPVTFQDFVWGAPGPEGLTIRFRFVAPDISRAVAQNDFSGLEADMQHLCETYALPRIANTGPQPSQVIISLSDRPVAFGEADPDATQFFEGYRPENGACIWEWF